MLHRVHTAVAVLQPDSAFTDSDENQE